MKHFFTLRVLLAVASTGILCSCRFNEAAAPAPSSATLAPMRFAAAAPDQPVTAKAGARKKREINAAFASSNVIVEVGSALILHAPPVPDSVGANVDRSKSRHYWMKDGEVSLGSGDLVLSNVTAAAAGEYTAVYTGAVHVATAPVYVSVVSYFTNQSNGGALVVPVGNFSSQAGARVCDNGESSVNMNRFVVYWPFDGANSTNASPDFPNTSNETNLLVSTCTNANPSQLDTAVQILENFGGCRVIACDDDSPPICNDGSKLSSCVAIGLTNSAQYRVSIYYKTQTAPAGLKTVTFRWKYSNSTTW